MVGLCVSLAKDLSHDPLIVRSKYARDAVHEAVVAGVTEHGDDFALAIEPTNGTGPEDGKSSAEQPAATDQAPSGNSRREPDDKTAGGGPASS
jgi:hypothetical protein